MLASVSSESALDDDRLRRWPCPARSRPAPPTATSGTLGRSTANSSPPRRATVSLSRRASRSRRAISCEQEVAAAMAEGVVDLLEAVEVDDHHRGPLALASRAVDRLLDAVVEQAPVGQAGERVGDRLGDVLPEGQPRPGHADHQRRRRQPDRPDGRARVVVVDQEGDRPERDGGGQDHHAPSLETAGAGPRRGLPGRKAHEDHAEGPEDVEEPSLGVAARPRSGRGRRCRRARR